MTETTRFRKSSFAPALRQLSASMMLTAPKETVHA
jgi:hypothetical protein